MPQDNGLDIEEPGKDTPAGAPKPGAQPKDKSLLEDPGTGDGVAGTGGEVKPQDQ